ncbi:MAG TPA: hypothetical protein VGM27_08800 [Acidobacteriaceae bacterium]
MILCRNWRPGLDCSKNYLAGFADITLPPVAGAAKYFIPRSHLLEEASHNQLRSTHLPWMPASRTVPLPERAACYFMRSTQLVLR